MSLTVPPQNGHSTFLYSKPLISLDDIAADIVVLGVPYGQPYGMVDVTNDQSNGPTAVRQATDRISRSLERYDFDLGGPILAGKPIRMADAGDVPGVMHDPMMHSRATEQAVRKILAARALPLVIGGDHAIPIPVMRAFDDQGPMTLVQVDAHIDWRDEVDGVREGLSSVIRRASEMAHIGEIFQIGLRSQGSARQEEVDAALTYGAHLITSYDVHDHGMDAVLARIPDGGRYYLTVDMDGIDPTIAPGVLGPAPGGLLFHQVRKLIHGLVAKGRVVGMDVVEITPRYDVNRITAITAGRFLVNLIGTAVRAGYFDAG